MNYKTYKELKKKYSNKVFSYKNKIHESKNFSRKDFSKTWNNNVLFSNTIFEQTNLDDSRFENCSFINCSFKNCFLSKSHFISVKFKSCTFKNVSFNFCNITSCSFTENEEFNVYFYPNSRNPIKDLTPSNTISANDYSDELKCALNLALKNKYIKYSNTLFLKKSQHLSKMQKREMKRVTPKEAKKLGLGKKERLKENARRKEMKNKWLLQTHKNAIDGKNRRLSKSTLNTLLWHFNNPQNVAQRLEYASHTIKSRFKNISYLVKIMEEF
ncbi:pentapeptide repeat-containing protein [Solibacillus silvestris]|uniref:pentapeptide repeat-containing protein n=1 Tax=Solibacillus silvestris TaxID=76853 RepID=UPI003F81D819